MSKGKSASAKMAKTGGEQFVGRKVTDLREITFSNVEEKLGLEHLTAGQKDSVIRILRSMEEYDQMYSDKSKPYTVTQLEFTQPFKNRTFLGEPKPDYTIAVGISTFPNSGNSLIDMWDRKWRSGLIGRNGGMFTYNKNGKRVNNSWEMRYGKKD